MRLSVSKAAVSYYRTARKYDTGRSRALGWTARRAWWLFRLKVSRWIEPGY